MTRAPNTLPIGVQDFEKLRDMNYVYIDKTEHMAPLLEGGVFFISRPRRFGKSLLLSTLKAIYEGKKHLFEGLWLEHNHDFKPRPVIRIDFSELDMTHGRLEESLVLSFQQTASEYGLELKAKSPKMAFRELLFELSKIDRVVILIDEYDKAITDYLFEKEKRLEHQAILRSIYGLLKPMDAHLHLVVLTGVSKIGKLSLFSDLNSLNDISLKKQYAQMFGYTRAEIEHAFPTQLKNAWEELELLEGEFWDILKYWYNGYSWDGKTSVYCPFSFLLFLDDPIFKGYWYQTGTPTFLIQLIEERKINPLELEHLTTNDQALSTFDLGTLNIVSIMFQTGYLTIKSLKSELYGVRYTLGYPNQEVKQAFSNNLLEQYIGQPLDFIDSLSHRIRENILRLEWDAFFAEVKAVYASIPSIITSKEKHFHALFHVLMCATGFQVYSELLTNKGRIDTLVYTRACYIIFEFKMEGTAQAALEQINTKDYAERFEVEAPVYKIGVVFDEASRNVKEWKVG
jgi:hypothetical protein